MNENYKEKFKIIQSNNENVNNVIKSEIVDDIDYNSIDCKTTKSMLLRNGSATPCIIRIVPTKRTSNLPLKSAVKTLTVKRAEYLKDTPSTSQLETADHEYVSRIIETETDNDLERLDKVSDSETSNVVALTNKRVNVPTTMTDSPKRPAESSLNVSPQKKSKVHSEKCCCTCRDILEDIQKKQQEILSYMKKEYHFTSRERKLDLLPSMPFQDLNDFLDFDESLTHENVQDQFLVKLRKLLVSSEQKSVSNVMSSIMTNELCRGISWIGIKDTLAFGSTNMVMLIVDLLQEHHQLEIDIIKARIAEWLRRCGDRIGNEMRKLKKKEEQGFSSLKQ